MADLYGLLTADDNNTQQNNDNAAYRQAQALQNTVLFDNLIKNISGNPIAASATANLLSENKNALGGTQEQLQEQAAQAANNLYQTTTTRNTPPSWLNDISGGYKENRNTPLSLANLAENTTSDGRQKGFAYRLGEGLGSLARIAESPLGRGLIMGGAVLADRNGDPLKALAYGTKVFTGNQANRLRDNTYRQQLEAEGIDTSKLGGGYLTDDTYKNTIDTANRRKEMNLKDREMKINETKAEYENQLKQLQIEEAQIKLSDLPEQVKYETLKKYGEAQKSLAEGVTAMDTELANLQQKQAVTENVIEKTKGEKIENQYKPQKLQNDITLQNIDIKYKPLKNQADIYSIYDDSNYKWSDLNERIKQNNIENQREANKAEKEAQNDKYQNPRIILGNIEQAWAKMPQSSALKGTSKLVGLGTALNNSMGIRNNNVTQYMALRKSMAAQLARSISGEKGVLTDNDIDRAFEMLPAPSDSYEQGKARLKAIYKLLDDLERGQLSGSSAKMINEYGLSNLASQNTKLNGGKVYSF
ncbi:MAG: hypothetical protein LUH05_03945 [Candidatus Gastranaerophilales bacterium]|nr:hypothetical protein [Candidatus Gastranaerophilales bacterium]